MAIPSSATSTPAACAAEERGVSSPTRRVGAARKSSGAGLSWGNRKTEVRHTLGAETVSARSDRACLYTPGQLAGLARQLITTLDEDGPGEDEDPPEKPNELLLTPFRDGSGGRIRGELDAVAFATIASAPDALSTPPTGEDTRPLPERKAHALAEICRFALDHGDDGPLPEAGGERPHLNVLVRRDDLRHRARAAVLDFGGAITAEQLRLLCCDARVVPIVMNGAGQPLDVGRLKRTVPDGLRRAVAARDRLPEISSHRNGSTPNNDPDENRHYSGCETTPLSGRAMPLARRP
ncbi:DUF222 domain-containing protein [Pseudonocardia sp. H11422]|uniref:DUF222 domain-containing protein n=1 Tax=Pseudonocardia sp. H11422 TaxID=2835866 RepID=UPI001BDC7D18|nr:DUF222 domain-containing protein [Pseudonocardia sp. H11422]